MVWRLIETAPTDDQEIIIGAWTDDGYWMMEIVTASEDEFDGGDFGYTRNICPFTHWTEIHRPPYHPVHFPEDEND